MVDPKILTEPITNRHRLVINLVLPESKHVSRLSLVEGPESDQPFSGLRNTTVRSIQHLLCDRIPSNTHHIKCPIISPGSLCSCNILHYEKRRPKMANHSCELLSQICTITLDSLPGRGKVLTRRTANNTREGTIFQPMMSEFINGGIHVRQVQSFGLMAEFISIVRLNRRCPVIITGKDPESREQKTEGHATTAGEKINHWRKVIRRLSLKVEPLIGLTHTLDDFLSPHRPTVNVS